MLLPQDAGWRGDTVRGLGLGQRARDPARPGPVPADRGGHRARLGIAVGEMVEAGVGGLEGRPRPVAPEVREVGAHRGAVAVEDLLHQRQLVKRLVPELPHRVRAEDALPGARQRRRDDQRAHHLRRVARDRLRDPAADVVAGDHRRVEPELLDQADHTARLRHRRVGLGRRLRVLVGLPEAAQVGYDHGGGVREQRNDIRVVGAVARPPVKQQDRRPGARPFVAEPEAVDRCGAGHGAPP